MPTLKKKISALLFLALVFSALLTGCNTMSGVGEDVQSAGGAIEDSAEKNKSY